MSEQANRDRQIERARANRDRTEALLGSGLPESPPHGDRLLDAFTAAGIDRPVEELMGNCQRNAVALRDELRHRDYEAVVVKGWVNSKERQVFPRDIGEAYERDAVHWWVEARIDNHWYTLDLARNDDEGWGDFLASRQRPPEYRPAEFEPEEMGAVREEYDLEPPQGLWDDDGY